MRVISATPFASPDTTFSRQGIARGARAMLALSAVVVLFGLTFGVASRQAGLSPWAALLMSAGVFAGASQFMALGMWAAPLPLPALWLSTLAVNARHLLLGAVLQPWFGPLPLWKRYGAVSVLSDANWAWSQEAHARGERDAGVLFGGGLVMWGAWVSGTALGAWLGRSFQNPGRFGLDVLLAAFFATVLVDTWKGFDDLVPWVAAGTTTLFVLILFPEQYWHVIAGALSGAAVGVLRDLARQRSIGARRQT